MIKIKLLLVFLSIASLLSCGDTLKSDFETKLAQDEFDVLNIKGISCKNQIDPPPATSDSRDILNMILQLQKISINWTEANPLVLYSINFTLYGDNFTGGQLTLQALGGLEISYLMTGSKSNVTVAIPTNNPTGMSDSRCSLQVGGITFVDDKLDSSGEGVITIAGYTTVNGKTETRVSRQKFNWNYNYQF